MNRQQLARARKFLWIIKLFGVVVFLILCFTIDFDQFIALLANTRVDYLIYAVLLSIISLNSFKVFRWHLILRWLGVDYNYFQTYITYQASSFVGLMTPGRLGEMFRSVYLKVDQDLPISAGIASTGADRIFDLFGMLTMAGTALLINPRFGESRNAGWYFISAAVFTLILVILFRLLKPETIAQKKILGSKTLARLFSDFNYQLRMIKGKRVLFQLLNTAVVTGTFTVQCWLLAHALGLDLDMLTAGGIAAAANLVIVIPVTVYGLGTREAAVISLMALLGFDKTHAFSFSLMHFMLFWIFAALWGFIFFMMKPMNIKKAKEIKQTELEAMQEN